MLGEDGRRRREEDFKKVVDEGRGAHLTEPYVPRVLYVGHSPSRLSVSRRRISRVFVSQHTLIAVVSVLNYVYLYSTKNEKKGGGGEG